MIFPPQRQIKKKSQRIPARKPYIQFSLNSRIWRIKPRVKSYKSGACAPRWWYHIHTSLVCRSAAAAPIAAALHRFFSFPSDFPFPWSIFLHPDVPHFHSMPFSPSAKPGTAHTFTHIQLQLWQFRLPISLREFGRIVFLFRTSGPESTLPTATVAKTFPRILFSNKAAAPRRSPLSLSHTACLTLLAALFFIFSKSLKFFPSLPSLLSAYFHYT